MALKLLSSNLRMMRYFPAQHSVLQHQMRIPIHSLQQQEKKGRIELAHSGIVLIGVNIL